MAALSVTMLATNLDAQRMAKVAARVAVLCAGRLLVELHLPEELVAVDPNRGLADRRPGELAAPVIEPVATAVAVSPS